MSKLNTLQCEVDINDIEYVVCHVGLLWRRLVNLNVKSLGVSGTERRVLFGVARSPGITQIQLANFLDLEPQNLIRTLDKLEKLTWLEKRSDPKDRRAKRLFVTPQAKKIMTQIKKISDKVKPNVLAGIKGEQIDTVIKHLRNIRENLHLQLEKVEKE